MQKVGQSLIKPVWKLQDPLIMNVTNTLLKDIKSLAVTSS